MPSQKDSEKPGDKPRNPRYARLLKVTKRLILMTLCGVLLVGAFFGATLIFGKGSWFRGLVLDAGWLVGLSAFSNA